MKLYVKFYWSEKVNLVLAGPEVIKLLSCSIEHQISTTHKTKIPKNEEVSCLDLGMISKRQIDFAILGRF